MSVLSQAFFTMCLLAALGAAQDAGVSNNDATAPDIKVAAASDLTAAMDKLAPAFQKQSGIHVTVSMGSSGNFFAQIQNGAPFDVFLSADKSYPEKLDQAGQAEPGSITPYARGRLVMWVPNSSPLAFAVNGQQVLSENLDALASDKVRKIAIANPEHAPYGRAAVAALQHFGVYDRVKAKLVLGENVSQTAQFAQSGNADVAFIALAQALSETLKRDGHWVALPRDSYPFIEQAGMVARRSRNKPEALRFLEFMRSPEGQAILREFGFESPAK